jgi:TRAP-type C4-dicarboxylate transport system substrate-binding protein
MVPTSRFAHFNVRPIYREGNAGDRRNSRDRPDEKAKMMIKAVARCTLLALVLFSSATAAEPIKLKLAFPTSDRAELYLYAIKPFVDAVNTEANGLIEIEVYFSGVLGGSQPTQPQLVLDGVADMALIASGQFQLLFPDDTVLELPGLFHDAREVTSLLHWAYPCQCAQGPLENAPITKKSSYPPGNIHSRKRLTLLPDLKGMKIGATSTIEATALERLGAVSYVLPVPQQWTQSATDASTAPPWRRLCLLHSGSGG